jgi:3-phosphoshikimate 1-carboxyvinyltransferase
VHGSASRIDAQAYSGLPLKGSVQVPGDKSLSHRVALFSALAAGTSQVRGLLDSLDVRSTLAAIQALGATVALEKTGSTLAGTITGWGLQGPRQPVAPLDCGNSGTTTRLLLGLLAGCPLAVTLTGDASLSKRPMKRVTAPLSSMGAQFSPQGSLPLTVRGSSELNAIRYASPVASAQVKSAVLLAGLSARGTTTVTEPHKSRDHTELLLPAYGVTVETEGLTVSISGGQRLNAFDCAVPGDPSSAAFLLVAAALTPGSAVAVTGVSLNPTRIGFVSVLQRMGAQIAVERYTDKSLGAEPVGSLAVSYTAELAATVVEAHEIPALIDELPILALLATAARGNTVFREVGELRVKESDRLAAIIEGLSALGCSAWASGDDLHVSYGPPQRGGALDAHDDHRLAMTWVVAARAFGLALQVEGLESISVSYPDFLHDMESLTESSGGGTLLTEAGVSQTQGSCL